MLATWKHGEKRDLHAEMMRLTLQIVGKTMFGVEVESEAEEVGKAIPALMKLNSNFRRLILIPSWLPTPVNLRAGLAVRRLHKIVDGIIARRRSSGEDKGDLLSTLIGARDGDGSQMDERQLRDEALTLFLAGHETTAVALSWTWWLLAQHAGVEAELHAELDSVLAGRPPSLADLARLPVAERIVTEAMRLYPPAWGMARIAVEDVEVAGYRIPRGAGVSFAQWVVHRDSRWYDAPEQFRPSRWEGDLARRIPRYAYFPFGGGPRQCIGNAFAMMEAVLLLCSISQRFRFRLLPEPPVVPVASITLRPRNGIPVEIEKRANLVRPA
jgi:cytochrome P450